MKHETPFETGSKSARKVYYDQAGNVTREQVQTNAVGASAIWSKTEYVYNNRGHLTSVTAYDGVTPALTTSYTYDAVSNLLTQSTNGATNTYTYDRFGNVLTVKDPLNQVESYVYDLGGRVTSRTDRNGWVTRYVIYR